MAEAGDAAVVGCKSSGSKRLRMATQMEEEADKLSVLPEPMIDLILSHLSIKDAARTSVLSSRWKFRSTRRQELVFDDLCTSISHPQSWNRQSNWGLAEIIDNVLLLHVGPIHKFVIAPKVFNAHSWNSLWISYLSRVSLRELVIRVSDYPRCKMPCSLFSCQDLVHLSLRYCYLNPPSTFGGFKHLKTLELCDCLLPQERLEKLISSCPLLDRMILKSVDQQINRLHIAAPKLQCLELVGTLSLMDVSFGANSLVSVIVSLSKDIADSGQARADLTYSSLLHFFGELRFLATLHVEKNLLKYWSSGTLHEKLPRLCAHLSSLSVDIDFNSVNEISTALCLLRSCPNLHRLKFSARSNGQRNVGAGNGFSESYQTPFPLLELKCALLDGILGTRLELGLIRDLLLNSPLLGSMIIYGMASSTSNRGDQLLKNLLQMTRASSQAKIIYLDRC